jgi:valyl-tRNA synthetase
MTLASRYDARVAIQTKLDELGLYRGKKDNPMVIPICSRSKDIIEPLPIPQWFCDCTSMAAKAVDAVRSGRLKIVPQHHEKVSAVYTS